MTALVRRLLERLLGIGGASWPGDDWARDFVDALDDEREAVSRARGRAAGTFWYAAQMASPRTWHFVWMMRRRRRMARATEGNGEGRGMRQGAASGWLAGLWIDLRQGARALLRDRRLAAFTTVTLGVAIGANAALFGVADRLFLRGPEHVRAPEELVRVFLHIEGEAADRTTQLIPWLTAEALRAAPEAFPRAALHQYRELLVETATGVRPLRVGQVGDGFFDLLGVRPALGSLLDGPDAGTRGNVVVLSHELWTDAWGGDPSVVGRSVRLGDNVRTVVGVAPPGFTGAGLQPVDAWVPLDPETAGNRNWELVARLPGGADGPAASAAVDGADAVHARTDPGRFFQWARDGRFLVAPLGADDEGREPAEVAVARFLFAVGGLTLLIGIANVVNLLLARLTRRRRELAVRLALGVGRWRLARLLLLESLALAALGGLASLPVAWAAGTLLRDVLLPGVAWPESPLDWRVVGASVAATLLTGVLVALLPAHRAVREDVADGLRSRGHSAGRWRGRANLSLAAAQVTLSAALLVCAGLFARSFWTLRVTDLGVAAEEVTAFTLHSLDPDGIPSPSAREHELFMRALDAVRGDPDVEDAAVSLGLPFLYTFGMSISVPGLDSIPALPGGGPYLSAVTAGYFDAVGTDILRGRDFTAAEVAGGAAVAVVSASMAERLWPGRDALGACLRIGTAESPCSRVVGVVENVHRRGYREPPSFQYYLPLAPGGGFGGMALALRLRSDGEATLARLRETVRGVDPAVDHVEATNLADVLAPQVRPWRLGAWVLAFASGLALLVSVVGVYGVLSYLVEQRRKEIGVRIALGASGGDIRRLVLRTGMVAAAGGLTLGVVLVLAAGRWIEPLLFETPVADPGVLLAVSAVLLLSAGAACLMPARRAARVEPVSCLSSE